MTDPDAPKIAPTETEVVPAPPPAGEREGILLVTVGDEAGRVVPLVSSKPATFGRADECTLVLADKGLSRVHARVVRVGSEYLLEDLGSKNGTFVNDERIEGVAHLVDGDRIRLGTNVRLRFSLMDAAEIESLTALSARDRTSTITEGARGGVASSRRPWALLSGAERVVSEPAMVALYELAHRAAQSPFSILVAGETGVGKEVLARAIHDASPRAKKPFLALNCAALTETLMEAELFGHEKGAFTGAVGSRAGLFESANGGTVFLDEVGELPLGVQAKLLRVLEDRKVMRVGGRTAIAVDVRFVAATNRDLEAEVEQGKFRQDLLFRINGITLEIPPLRERRSEIPALAELFAEAACNLVGRGQPPSFSPELMQALVRHDWPGNARELRNVVERAVALSSGGVLGVELLPAGFARPPAPPPGSAAEAPSTVDGLKDQLEQLEKRQILEVLEQCAWNQTRAAEALGISRRTLVSRLSSWGLTKARRSHDS